VMDAGEKEDGSVGFRMDDRAQQGKGDATLYSRLFSVAREADTAILALLVVPVFR